jgi:diacylglycerol kinase family enzyme
VAGGDGTQALVAGIAAGRDIPMMVISAGTRNHFALDLGLDCDDPSTCLDALSDGVKIASAAQAAGLLSAGQRSRSLTMLTAREVIIDAGQPQIPVGIDGESVLMPTPVRCTIRPLALRVQVPRGRPGVPEPRPQLDWALLRRQALTFTRNRGRQLTSSWLTAPGCRTFRSSGIMMSGS